LIHVNAIAAEIAQALSADARWRRSNMSRADRDRAAVTGALSAVLLMLPSPYAAADVLPPGGGDGSAGYRLASQWCRECHAIEALAVNTGKPAPDFVAVANLPSTTALALKVFLQSSHKTMPNFIIKPADADDLVAYILSLKRD
jgi:mono/diheme cytochrome c family protein